MKFKQFNKELNETNTYVSTALGTKKGLLSKGVAQSIRKQVEESDIDDIAKREFLYLLEQGKIEQALEFAVRAMTTSKGLRTSQMRKNKNKK
jgi:hypothetical protein